VLIAGEPDRPVVVDLYATRLPIAVDSVVDLTYRADAGSVNVELAVATAEPDGPGATPPYRYLPVNSINGHRRVAVRSVNGWDTATVPLTGMTGTVHALGIRLTAVRGPVRWRLGGLAVRPAGPPPTPAAPSGARITAADGGDLRLAWNPAPGAVRHHTVHRLFPDGTRRFLGATCQRAYFVAGLRPEQGERAARLEVRAVGELYTSSAPVTVTRTW
jgi:hypothetical protein